MRTSDFDTSLDWEMQNESSLNLDDAKNSQLYAGFSNQLIPVFDSQPKKNCKEETNHHFSLSDTYLAYDMRESYLQRQAATSISGQAGTTYLTTNEFSTNTCNVWRSQDPEIFPQTSNQLDLYGSSFNDRVSENLNPIRVKLTEQF